MRAHAPQVGSDVVEKRLPSRMPTTELARDNVQLLQRYSGNHAVSRLVQRLITQDQIRAEAEARWRRKGKIDQTDAEQSEDWTKGAETAAAIETEARAIFDAKGISTQSAEDTARDWDQARVRVRQRELAEDVWRARNGPSLPHDPVQAAQDWAEAGRRVQLEELWRRADPGIRLPGEQTHEVAARVAQARTDLQAVPGYVAGVVTALLAHDHGQSPRPFTTHGWEDSNGVGGHIYERHVRNVYGEDDERRRQAFRVCRHKIRLNSGAVSNAACPGKAGSFASTAEADAAIKRALREAFRENGGWAAAGGLRDRLARGTTVQKPYTVPVTGYCHVKADGGAGMYPAASLPAYHAEPERKGGRPYFLGDPEFAAGMAGLLQPKADPSDPDVYKKGADVIASEPNRPLTTIVAPDSVELRIVPSPNPTLQGWFVHSAWPVKA